MPYNEFGIPENHRDADKVIEQLARVVEMENEDYYNYTRGYQQYAVLLKGMEASVMYALHLAKRNPGYFLDIGCGISQAIAEIASQSFSNGLQFRATGLVKHPCISNNLGFKRFIKTPAETMNGINDNSVVGATAVHSIAYTASPEMTIQAINRILVPGAVLKGVFAGENNPDMRRSELYGHKRVGIFKEMFESLDYQTEVTYDEKQSILLAIKSPSPFNISARLLMNLDTEMRKNPSLKLRTDFKRVLEFQLRNNTPSPNTRFV